MEKSKSLEEIKLLEYGFSKFLNIHNAFYSHSFIYEDSYYRSSPHIN